MKETLGSTDNVQYLMIALGLSNMIGRFSSGSLIFCKSASATIFGAIGAAICGVTCVSIAFVDDNHLAELIIVYVRRSFYVYTKNKRKLFDLIVALFLVHVLVLQIHLGRLYMYRTLVWKI